MINPCGYECDSKCPHFQNTYEGCSIIEGKVFWAKYYNKTTCPIYQCAKDKGYKHCGYCSDLPCNIWFETRDPSITDESIIYKEIEKRIKQLKANM